jgi:hypothetical protein
LTHSGALIGESGAKEAADFFGEGFKSRRIDVVDGVLMHDFSQALYCCSGWGYRAAISAKLCGGFVQPMP